MFIIYIRCISIIHVYYRIWEQEYVTEVKIWIILCNWDVDFYELAMLIKFSDPMTYFLGWIMLIYGIQKNYIIPQSSDQYSIWEYKVRW